MALTTAALANIADAIMGGTTFTKFTNAAAHIGVGDSNTTFSAAHTDLQASTNKVRKAMESSYPSRSTAALTFRSVFGTSDANFDWEEWGVFNASTSGEMLNRKVEDLGTKTSAVSRQLTVTLTFALA